MNQVTKLAIGTGVVCIGLVWFLLRDQPNEAVLSDIAPKADSSSAIKIIAFGDSLTAGYGLPQSESYPAQLETALRSLQYSVSVINSGVSGETTRGNLERASFIRSQNPDVVLLGIGGNDDLRALPPVVVLLAMQAPLNAGLGYKREFDGMYELIAEETGSVIVPFITAEVFLSSENKLSDGIHYNKTGYAKVVELYLLPVMREIMTALVAK